MGLIRQILDVDVVFTSHDGLTTNTLTRDSIKHIEITEQDLTGGKGSITIDNLSGANKAKFYEGYTAEVKVQFSGAGSKTAFWLGRVKKKYPTYPRMKDQSITCELIDEGTYILTGATTTSQHAHSSVDAGYIVKDLIDTYCSDISTTNVDVATGRTISITIPVGRNIMDTIRELLEGTGFSFRVTEGLAAYLIERGTGADYTLGVTNASKFIVDRDIESVKNVITVRGAYIADASVSSQAGPPDGYWAIDNDTNRRTAKFTPSGSVVQVSVTAINNATPASTHNMLIRIQPDDGTGTAPVDVANYSADIGAIFIPCSVIATAAAAAVGGVLSASLINDVNDYWLIVESDSATGNTLFVGYKTVSAVDKLIFECYTQVELTATESDATSQGLYGPREYTHTDRTLKTQDEVDEKALALLAEYKDISQQVSCDLEEDIFSGAHARIGDGITTTLTDEGLAATELGLISITWIFEIGNGPWLAVPTMIVSDTSPALTDGDWAAQVSRQIGTVANNVSVLEASVASIGIHGWAQHSAFTLAEINAKLTDGTLDKSTDTRTPKAHDHEAVDDVLSTGEIGGTKFLREDGDGTCSWQPAATEGTAVKSTGEVGGTKFLREDGDGTSSWQTAATGPPEGTAVLSTGEAGGTKFLREDGDGTCSWQSVLTTPTDVSITCYNGTGSAIAANSICYISGDSSGTPTIILAKADAVATTRGMMVMTKAAIANAASGSCQVIGKQAGFTSLTAAMPVYLSNATAGSYTQTIPTTSAHFVRIIGYATRTTEIYFNPDKTYIKRV